MVASFLSYMFRCWIYWSMALNVCVFLTLFYIALQIAGIILDNYARGRTKHVWFSISSDLIVDAKR